MPATQLSRKSRVPSGNTYTKTAKRFRAPKLERHAIVEEFTVDSRSDPPEFGSAHPKDETFLLVGIGPEKGEPNKKTRTLTYLANLSKDAQKTYGYAIAYNPGETEPTSLTWHFQILPSDFEVSEWSEDCPVPGYENLRLTFQNLSVGLDVYASVTVAYSRLPSLAEQADLDYSTSYPYPNKDYPQVTWSVQALRNDVTTKREFGSVWTDLEGNTDHEYYAIRNELKLINQYEQKQRGSVFKRVTYIFLRLPADSVQDGWNASPSYDHRHRVTRTIRRYDTFDRTTAKPTGLILQNTIPGAKSYLRQRVQESIDRLPPTRREQRTIRYTYPAVFGLRLARSVHTKATVTYSYSHGEVEVDLPTQWQDELGRLMLFEAVALQSTTIVEQRLPSIYRFWAAQRPIVHPTLGVTLLTITRDSESSTASMETTIAIPASENSTGIDPIVVNDLCSPWAGDIWERVRITIPGFSSSWDSTGNANASSIAG